MVMGKHGAALLAVVLASALVGLAAGGNFYEECDATWEPQNCWAYDDGNRLSLALVSNSSGYNNLVGHHSITNNVTSLYYIRFDIKMDQSSDQVGFLIN